MAYANRPMETVERRSSVNVVDLGERIHWGAIAAGLVIAISTQLLLSGVGAALGFTTIANSGAPRTNAPDVGAAVGIWSIISLFISLFVGGWITARASGSINRGTAAFNGAILWATTLAISAFLLASGVTGTFGFALANAGDISNQIQQSGISIPNVNPANPSMPNGNSGNPQSETSNPIPNLSAEQTREAAANAAKAGWSFTFGALLGLSAAMIGGSLGARKARVYANSGINSNQ
jgi:hypothetical protein